MARSKTFLRELFLRWRRRPEPARPLRPLRSTLTFEDLEGRVVLSPIGVGIGDGIGGRGGPQFQGGGGYQGLGTGGGFGGGCLGGSGGGTSSLLTQDARSVQQAFQAFDASYLSAAATLRLTATGTTAPTSDGVSAFDAAIAKAVTKLEAAVSTDLANLTNTGATLAGTIDGDVAALQIEIEGAATGLAGSTNSDVLAMNKEVNTYLQTATRQTTGAILTDAPAGTVTSSTIVTYKQAAAAAATAFHSSIATAEQASITGGAALDSTAVKAAVSTLQADLNTAVGGLGTAFTASAASTSLSATLTTDLSGLTTALEGITSPTVGNTASQKLFLRTVNVTLMQYESKIDLAVLSAVHTYNNGLL